MFMKSAMRAPFYFFAGEEGGAGGSGAPAGAIGSGATSEPVHGTAPDPGPDPKPAAPEAKPAAKETPKGDPAPKADLAPKPAAKAAPEPKTAADGGGGDPNAEVKPVATEFPPDWREKMAGDDKGLLKRLERMKEPSDLLKAWRAMEVERDSGRWAKKLPTHPTAEELVEYQKANGIPDKPEGYDDNLGNGFVWGEADKDALDHFKQFAHERNMTPAEVKRSLEWYPLYQEHIVNQLNENDLEHAGQAKIDFRSTWGAKEPANLNFLKNQFQEMKEGWKTIAMARGPDGRLLGNNPDIMKFFLEKFKNADPAAYDLPGNGSAPSQSLAEEKAAIKPLMANKKSEYWVGPKAPAMQARYREIIEHEERAKLRASL